MTRPGLKTLLCVLFVTSVAAQTCAVEPSADGGPPTIVRKLPPPAPELSPSDAAEVRAAYDEIRAGLDTFRPLLTPDRPEWADIEIFAKALDFALRHGEFFDPQRDLARARTLHKTALDRLSALKEGRAPWLQASGVSVRGFRSRIDDSYQPYGLIVPENLSPFNPVPLYVWLHGRGDTQCDLQFISGFLGPKAPGPLQPTDAIVLHPFGRYCNGWKSAGEVDVFETIADVQRRYPIDADRIVIAGFSMGGAGAWHLGAHYTNQWCAVHAGAGFVDVRRYQNITPDKLPPAYEQKLWGLYDVPDYRRNLLNVPVVAYSGELDKQKASADIMEAELAAEGLKLAHFVGPGMGHKYHPEVLKEVQARLAAHVAAGRNIYPQKVHLQTKTARYGRMFWIQAYGLERSWDEARVDAEVTSPTSIRMTTKNVRSLRVVYPPWPGRDAFRPTDEIVVDGRTFTAPQDGKAPAFERGADGWSPYDPAKVPDGFQKVAGVQGPIDDAFMEPFTIVLPDEMPETTPVDRHLAFEARHFIDRWRMLMRGEPRVRKVSELTEDDLQRNLVLWGTPQSNRLVAEHLRNMPLTWTADRLEMGDQRHDPRQVVPALIYPRRIAPGVVGYVVINSGLTFREAHDRTNSLQNPKLGDWAFIDVTQPPTDEAPGRVLAAGFFDDDWKYQQP